MARRRRRRWRRVKPDMGWFIDEGVLQVNMASLGGGVANGIGYLTVMGFTDIDSDPSAITQDKSDWFIKRVIVDCYPTLARGSTGTTLPTRIYEVGIGTMESENLQLLNSSNGDTVIDGDTYGLWRRLFRTYSKPVYATGTYTLDANGDLVVQDGGTAVENLVVDSPWGESAIHDDFTVSNAGLVENAVMAIVVSSSDIVSPAYHWNVGEALYLGCTTRVLLQKRRG